MGLVNAEGCWPVIGVPYPQWADADERPVGVLGALQTVRVLINVASQAPFTLVAREDVGAPLALNAHFVIPADNRGDLWGYLDIAVFSRSNGGVEHDLPSVGCRNVDEGGLGCTVRARRLRPRRARGRERSSPALRGPSVCLPGDCQTQQEVTPGPAVSTTDRRGGASWSRAWR